ncbi:MAG: hypothetical protein KC420_20360, partial [Myxococcales bacterium]|nr:hypothetical protein [Myxococcales bacterium]
MIRAGLSGLLVGLAFGLGGCFNAPASDVAFSCDPPGSGACPAGYTCGDDGCCHREGSDPEANAGACKLGASGGSATLSTGASDSGSTSTTGSTTSTSAPTTSTSGDPTTSSTGTSTSGTSGTGTSGTTGTTG